MRQRASAVEDGLLALLACPQCRAALRSAGHGLECLNGHRFDVRDGVPALVPPAPPETRLDEWKSKQSAAVPEYESEIHDSGRRTETTVWTIGRLFGEFWSSGQAGATALDVGCGMYEQQSYYRAEWRGDRVSALVGLDPMFRSGEREYEFVQGMAERLPFRGDAFDVVLFATSLDHIVDIRAAMREAARVLKPTGELAVWISVFDPGLHSGVMRALRRVERRAPWHPRSLLAFARVLVELVISLRFDWRDRFHLHRLELSQLRGDVAAAGLTITEQLLIHDGSQSVPHVFLRAGASKG